MTTLEMLKQGPVSVDASQVNEMTGKQLVQFAKEQKLSITGFQQMAVAQKKVALQEALGGDVETGTTAFVPSVSITEGSADIIGDVVHQVESADEVETITRIRGLQDSTELDLFTFGGLLSAVQENHWFGEDSNFRSWVERQLDISYRKAAYLSQIYKGVVGLEVTWEQIAPVGWTKLKELLPVVTKDTVVEWLEVAKGLTTLQLHEHVKQALLVGTGEAGDVEDINSVTTKTFKLHEDQRETVVTALSVARDAAETEYDSVALEYICLDYLNNGQSAGAGSGAIELTSAFKALGYESVLKVFEEVWPEVELEVTVPE
jgi:hypothetical protein